jgi:hypothetical protein
MSELRIAEQDGKGVELVIEIVKKKKVIESFKWYVIDGRCYAS